MMLRSRVLRALNGLMEETHTAVVRRIYEEDRTWSCRIQGVGVSIFWHISSVRYFYTCIEKIGAISDTIIHYTPHHKVRSTSVRRAVLLSVFVVVSTAFANSRLPPARRMICSNRQRERAHILRAWTRFLEARPDAVTGVGHSTIFLLDKYHPTARDHPRSWKRVTLKSVSGVTRGLRKWSFNHSIGCTHNWRILYQVQFYIPGIQNGKKGYCRQL